MAMMMMNIPLRSPNVNAKVGDIELEVDEGAAGKFY
jgi:hypothetical protein